MDFLQKCQSLQVIAMSPSIVNANVSWTLPFTSSGREVIGMDRDTAVTHKSFGTSEENTYKNLKSIITDYVLLRFFPFSPTDEVLRSFSLNCNLKYYIMFELLVTKMKLCNITQWYAIFFVKFDKFSDNAKKLVVVFHVLRTQKK